MAKSLITLPKKRSAFMAIKAYLLDDGVQLRVEEEEILNRWIYVDALMRKKEKDEDGIISDLMAKFNIKVHTARNDMYSAQRLFADARKVVKKYLMHLHVARIDQDIQRVREIMFKKDKNGDPYPLDAKDISALAKLHETYTYTMNSMPDQDVEDKTPPPKFVFMLPAGQVIQQPMAVDEAMAKADSILMHEKNGVYTAETETDDDNE